jgi:hypothetical protein
MDTKWTKFIAQYSSKEAFNKAIGIDFPYRTWKQWVNGERSPAQYVQDLMMRVANPPEDDDVEKINLSVGARETLKHTVDQNDPWSLETEISRIIESYANIFANTPVRFTIGEWSAILDANNGTLMDAQTAFGIAANVFDSSDFSEKWGVNNDELGAKMMKMSYAALFRVAEMVHRYWTYPTYQEKQPEEFLPSSMVCPEPLADPEAKSK